MTTQDQIVNIPLADLKESPFNPRSVFNEAALAELAADIKATGRVLSPLLVRPTWSNPLRVELEPNDGHEIVFGHRRFRAAKLAGLSTVPCMVRQMEQEEARRAQISENIARADVHPIEEAEGFAALMKYHSVSADDLVTQTGKSRSYIYGRLVLLKACPEVRKACLAGEIGSETALLIARLRTDKIQAKALAKIKSAYVDLEDGGSQSFRKLRELLTEHFTLNLSSAMFDTADAPLLPDAGACTSCPKRTGNAPEYQDLTEDYQTRYSQTKKGSPDICTDPDCFEAKKKAHLAAQAKVLRDSGKTVVDGNKARSSVDSFGHVKGAFLPLTEVKAQLAKLKKDKAAAGTEQAAIQTVLIQDPRTGKTHEAVEVKALQAAGLKVAAPEKKPNHQLNYQQQQEDRVAKEQQAKKLTADNMALLQRVRGVIAKTPRDAFDLALVARTCLNGVQYRAKEQLAGIWYCNSFEQLQRRLGSMNVADLTRLMMDCALIDGVRVDSYQLSLKPDALLSAAKHYGVSTGSTSPEEPAAQAKEEADEESLAEA